MSAPLVRPGLHPVDRPAAPDAPFATLEAPVSEALAAALEGRALYRWSHGGHLAPTSRAQRLRYEKQLAADLAAGSFAWEVGPDGDVALVATLPSLASILGPSGPPEGQLALVLAALPPAPQPAEALPLLTPLTRGYDGAALAAVLEAWPGAVALRFAAGGAQLFGAPEALAALAPQLKT